MRILQIHTVMRGGGVEAMICGLANEMSKTEDVTVCSIFQPSENDVFWNKLDSRVKRITLGKKGPSLSIKPIFQIWRLLQREKYDVVNIHGVFYYYLLSVFTLFRRTKFFYTIHSDAKMENTSREDKVFAFKKFAFKKRLVNPITISPASKQSFTDLYGIESRLINNGVVAPSVLNESEFIKQYRFTKDTKVFVHPGRICLAKNQVVLCRVFERLVNEGEDIVLIIAGNVDDKEIYSQVVGYFSERIVYVGERNDIPQLLASADGFCLSSIWEGLPVSLLEAISVGCIPICTPVGGIVNVVEDGKNGILSANSNEEEYYEAMKRILQLPKDKLKEMKSNAIESFAPYDIRSTAKQYLSYYRENVKIKSN